MQRALQEAALLEYFALILGDEDFGSCPLRLKGRIVRDNVMPYLGAPHAADVLFVDDDARQVANVSSSRSSI